MVEAERAAKSGKKGKAKKAKKGKKATKGKEGKGKGKKKKDPTVLSLLHCGVARFSCALRKHQSIAC